MSQQPALKLKKLLKAHTSLRGQKGPKIGGNQRCSPQTPNDCHHILRHCQLYQTNQFYIVWNITLWLIWTYCPSFWPGMPFWPPDLQEWKKNWSVPSLSPHCVVVWTNANGSKLSFLSAKEQVVLLPSTWKLGLGRGGWSFPACDSKEAKQNTS